MPWKTNREKSENFVVILKRIIVEENKVPTEVKFSIHKNTEKIVILTRVEKNNPKKNEISIQRNEKYR